MGQLVDRFSRVECCPGSAPAGCVMKVFLLVTTLALTQARPREPDHYLAPWERVVRTVGSGRAAPLNVPTALRLEADEELNLIGSEHNNIAFDLFEVKNGSNDDVRWEEKEVRKAEQEQVDDIKEFVNLKLPGAFVGTSLQKVDVVSEDEKPRWENARPRSLEYYNQFIDTREVDQSSKGGDVYIVSQCCHEVNIQGR